MWKLSVFLSLSITTCLLHLWMDWHTEHLFAFKSHLSSTDHAEQGTAELLWLLQVFFTSHRLLWLFSLTYRGNEVRMRLSNVTSCLLTMCKNTSYVEDDCRRHAVKYEFGGERWKWSERERKWARIWRDEDLKGLVVWSLDKSQIFFVISLGRMNYYQSIVFIDSVFLFSR